MAAGAFRLSRLDTTRPWFQGAVRPERDSGTIFRRIISLMGPRQPTSMRDLLRQVVPPRILEHLRGIRRNLYKFLLRRLILEGRFIQEHCSARELNLSGISATSVEDYYSPLPVLLDLEKNKSRWAKPSEL